MGSHQDDRSRDEVERLSSGTNGQSKWKIREALAATRRVLMSLYGAHRSRDEQRSKTPGMNVLEWLSARRFPDTFVTLVLSILAATTLSPYLGGETLGSVGTSSLTITTVNSEWVWFVIIVTPIFWILIVAQVIHSRRRYKIGTAAIAVGLSMASLYVHQRNPWIVLNALETNFHRTLQFDFLNTQRTWEMSSNHGTYCYFRTEPTVIDHPNPLLRDEGKAMIHDGCTVRIERIELGGNGYALLEAQSAFDLDVYVSAGELLPSASACVPASQFHEVLQRPPSPDVAGRLVVEVRKEDAGPRNSMKYYAAYNFGDEKAEARPAMSLLKDLNRRDMVVAGRMPRLQLSGWTLHSEVSSFGFYDFTVRIAGKVQCKVWS